MSGFNIGGCMRFSHVFVSTVTFVPLLALAPCEGWAQQALPAQTAAPARTSSITVPEGTGAPVVTDGMFSPGEWDDALQIPLNEVIALHLKQYRGVVYVGARGKSPTGLGPTDLFLAVPGELIHQLHVSAQLGEIVLPQTGEAPAFRFGLTPDWYANEQRRDMGEAERLEKEGKSPYEIIRATTYPSDGIEFAIRRSKLPGQRWLMRLGTSFFSGDKPGWLVYPTGAAERTTDGWLELRFN